ncbi:MAG: glycosyltransferase family 4 protein [Deltaproteobacteria bacterium]|nr:glycosyltransferase family 4 protein [Deltaproteobacteria bacterium]
MKKICYICYRRFPDTNFQHYSKAVSDNGYHVTVVSFLDTGQEVFEILDGRKIYRIPLPSNRGKRSSMFTFILHVVKFVNRHDFSIVHIHHTCAYFSLIRMLASNGAKFVYHTTSYPISNTRLQAQKDMIITFIQSLLMNKIIVQSEELKEKLIGIRGLKRTEVIPVGFNRKILYPIAENEKRRLRNLLNIHKNGPVLVYCGVIAKLRQLDRLMEAFKKVQTIFEDVKLVMIGDGNALEEIKTLASSLQIEKNMIFTGRIPHHEVVNYIGIGDIGISYIPINENYHYNPPLKTFEYLACGLPTVATRTVSNCKIIKHDFNGILCNDSPEDVLMSIVNLLRDKDKQTLLRKNARKSIMAFDFEHITKTKLIPLYESLLA